MINCGHRETQDYDEVALDTISKLMRQLFILKKPQLLAVSGKHICQLMLSYKTLIRWLNAK